MEFKLREIQVRAQSANNHSDLRVLEFREEKICLPTQVTILRRKVHCPPQQERNIDLFVPFF
jgi:hypothetical protein